MELLPLSALLQRSEVKKSQQEVFMSWALPWTSKLNRVVERSIDKG